MQVYTKKYIYIYIATLSKRGIKENKQATYCVMFQPERQPPSHVGLCDGNGRVSTSSHEPSIYDC